MIEYPIVAPAEANKSGAEKNTWTVTIICTCAWREENWNCLIPHENKGSLCLQISQTQRAPYLSGNELFQLKIIGQLIFLHNKKTLSLFLVGSLEVDQLFRIFCPKYVLIQGTYFNFENNSFYSLLSILCTSADEEKF